MAKTKLKQRQSKQKGQSKKALKATPLQQIHAHVTTLLNDLDCILEAFEVIDPLLEQKDKERRQEVIAITKRLSDLDGKETLAASHYEELLKFIATIRRLGRGHTLYRNNSLISLVSRFDEFIGDIIRAIHKQHPDRLKKSEKTLTYEELTALSSIGQAVDRLIDKEVDKVLRDSHASQIKYLEAQLSVEIRDQIPVWNEFIELTERRNLLVHCGGEVSSQYLKICKNNNCCVPDKLKEGKILSVDPEYFKRCHAALVEVSVKLSQVVLRNLFPRNLRDIDLVINNYGVQLLADGRWQLALIVFEYLCGLSPKQTSEDYLRRAFIINKAIALKFSGKNGACQQLLAANDWSGSSSAFALAVAVLRDEFEKAEKLMSGMNGREPIGEVDFKTWPIFREFRKSENFRRAFKAVYNRDFEPVDEAKKAVHELQETAASADSSTTAM